jgi:hypothetical protein
MATAAPPQQGSTFGAALTWVQTEYGYLCHEVESFPGIPFGSTPATQVIGQNGDRLGLVIVNQGVTVIYISLSTSVSQNDGIILTANGGSLTMNVRQDQTLPTRAWFAISPAAPGQLYVLEIIGWRKFPPGSIAGY